MAATYAQSRQELIEAFRPRAQRFAELVRNRHLQSWSQDRRNIKRYHPTKMDFGYLADTFPIHHAEFTTSEIPGGQEGIKFWFNPWCFIAYYDIRPKAGAKPNVDRSPAQIISKRTVGGNRVNADNKTGEPQPMKKRFAVVTGKGGSTDIGAKASASFRQTIKAGSEATGFTSETELTAAVEASTNVNKWMSTEIADETEWEGVVPPHTRRIVSRLLEVGKYRQQVTIDGQLEASIYILSRGDFDVKFDDFDDLSAVLNGVGNTGKGGHYSDWARAYSAWPVTDPNWIAEQICGPVNARVIEFDESDQAGEESFAWEDEPIEAA